MVVEEKTSILMVIIKKENLWKLVDNLKDRVDCPQFLVLKTNDEQYEDFFFVIYEAYPNQIEDKQAKFTVVHKKGRCYYTINALNTLVMSQNGGVMDNSYLIDWEQYQNRILFLNREKELINIESRLYKIIKN